MIAHDLFEKQFKNIDTSIAFDPAWNSVGGYVNNAAIGDFAPVIEPGQVVKCFTHDKRLIIIAGSEKGNIVAMERYSGSNVILIVYNAEINDAEAQRIIASCIFGDPELSTEIVTQGSSSIGKIPVKMLAIFNMKKLSTSNTLVQGS